MNAKKAEKTRKKKLKAKAKAKTQPVKSYCPYTWEIKGVKKLCDCPLAKRRECIADI